MEIWTIESLEEVKIYSKKGWDEDDAPTIINKVEVNKNSFIKPKEPVIIQSTPLFINREPDSKKINYDYENKLIDDLLKPTGVNIKPTDNQLNDFIKRVRTLNKDIVYNNFVEKLKNYENTNNDPNLMKQLMVNISII